MGDHVRKQFRQAVALVVTGLATTGANVFQSRAYRLDANQLPALRVYTEGEEAQPLTIHTPEVRQRTVTIVVAGVQKKLDTLEDTLDAISAEVEAALSSVVTVGAQKVPLVYLGTEVSVEDEGDFPTGEIQLRYQATLFNVANTPDVLA